MKCASSPESAPTADQAPVGPTFTRKSRRKLYTVIGIIAVAAVALALASVFLILPSMGETIPLSYTYTPGEEMTYNLTATVIGAAGIGQNMSVSQTLSMKIISFDGENYTINETSTTSTALGQQYTFSFMTKMNKTGYITYLNGTSGLQQTYSMFNGVWSFGPKTEVRTGETLQIPMNQSSSDYSFNGTVVMKFGEIQNITVPAGEYRIFKIDISSDNMSMVVTTPPPVNMSISETFSVSGRMFLEYGTCRLVKSELYESMSMQQGTLNTTQTMSMQMELVQHIKS